jgi:membrane-associated phospholipid phosphatase
VDVALFRAINDTHVAILDPFMVAATWLGVGAGVWFALALIGMAWPRHRAAAARTILALAVTLGVNDQIVKPLVDRDRPFEQVVTAARVIQQPRPTTPSFPSGHSATAVVGAVSLARLWPHARWALGLLGALIAFSRIYVGVHFPTDVAAGVLLGAGVAWLVLGGRHPSTWSRPAEAPSGVQHVL